MIKINQIKLHINQEFDSIFTKISKILKVPVENINKESLKILKKSIDLRDKNYICYVYNIAIEVDNETDVLLKNTDNNVTAYIDTNRVNLVSNLDLSISENNRPIIIGFGPAGMFCAYVLALNGLKPIVLERGKEYTDRNHDVNNFLESGHLIENSNITFGEGGAGTFSDGKLNTNNNDKDGLMYYVLSTFVKFGANEKIIYENNSHIGTDVLKNIIQNMRKDIINLGGEIRFNYKWTYKDDINTKYNSPKILCIGNSARDTFYDLYKNGFDIKAKSLAMGFRVAHKQKIINEYQYHNNSLAEKLGNATYKLIHKIDNKTIYSFCTCPGGYIINSSNFDYYTSINGMSYSDRSNIYINSAIVINFDSNDYDNNDPFSILKLQKLFEEKTFDLANWKIPYCYLGDFIENNYVPDTDNDIDKCFYGRYQYTKDLVNVYKDVDIKFDFNKTFLTAMEHFGSIIPGFDSNDTIIAGVETRTSSPVSLSRDDNFMSNIKDYYPCGEGLGHGGGIMSCAIDGIKMANKIIERYRDGQYQ